MIRDDKIPVFPIVFGNIIKSYFIGAIEKIYGHVKEHGEILVYLLKICCLA